MKTAIRVPSGGSSGATLRVYERDDGQFAILRNPNTRHSDNGSVSQQKKVLPKVAEKKDVICKYWRDGNCVYGDKCRFLHSWIHGDGFVKLTQLEGHKKAVSGIALPSGSDKLYSASRDGTMRAWDRHTGQCISTLSLGAEVGCLISEGHWIFVGMPNVVRAWNTRASTDYTLDGPVGQVYALRVGKDVLFAGAADGAIMAWKPCSETGSLKLVAALTGHTKPVVSLAVGNDRLYSGSIDHTIRVWDIDTLKCTHTLHGHNSVVMSLLCWNQFLFSASLDNTVKVWVANSDDNLEVTYTHTEKHGILSLAGTMDHEQKPLLLCACNDNSLHLYELPTFTERGRYFTRKEVRTIQTGPGGLIFSGDASGNVGILKLTGEAQQKAT